MPDALVTTEWLAARLDDPNVRTVDATYHLPTVKRDARAEFQTAHIPGASFFDIDGIADRSTSLPHMIPSPQAFADAVGALGIGDDDLVVAYGMDGNGTAPRAWWMFRVFGHDKVRVLDGGLAKWKAEGRPVESGPARPAAKKFAPRFRPELVRSRAEMLANVKSRAAQVVDARPGGRFRGVDPEPRAGLRGGHIPGSRSLPLGDLIDPKSLTFRSPDEVRAKFIAAGIDLKAPIVTSCGSGVTASGLALGLFLLGRDDVAVYDGSWSEWGLPGDTPVETG